MLISILKNELEKKADRLKHLKLIIKELKKLIKYLLNNDTFMFHDFKTDLPGGVGLNHFLLLENGG